MKRTKTAPVEVPANGLVIPANANALPVVSRRRRKKKSGDRPATQEERDTMQIKAIMADFDWSNEHWATTWLPWVRIAAFQVNCDQDRLKEGMATLVKVGEAPNLLEGLTRTKMHLEALIKLIHSAQTRSFLVLERLGYSPDNPPPDSRMN